MRDNYERGPVVREKILTAKFAKDIRKGRKEDSVDAC
jgi:hypothetical protein